MNAKVCIEMPFAGPSGPWTDVCRDVRLEDGVRMERGIQGNGPKDRVASTGTLSFALDNSHHNAAGLEGWYSPNHPSARPGFKIGIGVRLRIENDMFVGTLDSIEPIAGRYGSRKVLCTAVDWMDEAARFKLSGVPTQTNVRSDQIVSTILDSMPKQPAGVSLDAGRDIYEYALDNARDESTTALSEFQRIEQSELGQLYLKGDGTLRAEHRHRRASTSANVMTLRGTMFSITARRSRAEILNKVHVTVHPRRIDATDTNVLYSLESKPQIAGGQTATILGQYLDPTQRANRVGGTDMRPLVAGVDYTMNTLEDGAGLDVTASFTVNASFGGNGVRFEVTNMGTTPGFVIKLRCRGRGVYDYEHAIAEAKNAASIEEHGENVERMDMPYQSSVTTGLGAAKYLLSLYKDPLTYVHAVTLFGQIHSPLMAEALRREISDRIGLTESVTGLSDVGPDGTSRGYFINAVALEILHGDVARLTWTLAPADRRAFWLVGVPGASELGRSTHLGYV
jgi:hypothetical protein